jgi:hypothetical protein
MRGPGYVGLVVSSLVLIFWALAPEAGTRYAGAAGSSVAVAFVVLAGVALVGSLLSGLRPGASAAMMAAGILPAMAAFVLPGVVLGIAVLAELTSTGAAADVAGPARFRPRTGS